MADSDDCHPLGDFSAMTVFCINEPTTWHRVMQILHRFRVQPNLFGAMPCDSELKCGFEHVPPKTFGRPPCERPFFFLHVSHAEIDTVRSLCSSMRCRAGFRFRNQA
jgi:hypothetical protein